MNEELQRNDAAVQNEKIDRTKCHKTEFCNIFMNSQGSQECLLTTKNLYIQSPGWNTHMDVCRHTALNNVPFKCPTLLFRCAEYFVNIHLHREIYINSMCVVIITLPELHYLHLKQMSFRCNVKSQNSNEVYLSNPISLMWASATRHEALEATHACILTEFEVRSKLCGQGPLGLHILKYDPTRVAETPLQMQKMEKYL